MLPQTVEALIKKKKKKIEAIEKFDLSINYFFRLPFSPITAAKRCCASLKRVSLTHRYHNAAKNKITVRVNKKKNNRRKL